MRLVFRKGAKVEHLGIFSLKIFLWVGAVVAVILTLLLRNTADQNYRLGKKPIARFETFLAFVTVLAALAACITLFYIDKAMPS